MVDRRAGTFDHRIDGYLPRAATKIEDRDSPEGQLGDDAHVFNLLSVLTVPASSSLTFGLWSRSAIRRREQGAGAEPTSALTIISAMSLAAALSLASDVIQVSAFIWVCARAAAKVVRAFQKNLVLGPGIS